MYYRMIGLLLFCASLSGCKTLADTAFEHPPRITVASQELKKSKHTQELIARLGFAGTSYRFVLRVNRVFSRRPTGEDAKQIDTASMTLDEQSKTLSLWIRLNTGAYGLAAFPALIELHHRSGEGRLTLMGEWWVTERAVTQNRPPRLSIFYLVNTYEMRVKSQTRD